MFLSFIVSLGFETWIKLETNWLRKTDLMLYEATLKSTPRPERLPSKSAAKLSSMSSNRQPATRFELLIPWAARFFKKKKNYFQNFNKIQTARAYSATVEAQIIENWMNKKAIKWFTCSGSGRSITRQSWTIAHLHYFSSVCLRTNKQFHWINCHENRYAEHVIIKLQLTQVNCVFF